MQNAGGREQLLQVYPPKDLVAYETFREFWLEVQHL